MKLNRREFLRATGLTGLLAAFGVKLPEVEAAEKLPVITADVVVPSTGRIEIQYEDGAGRWTSPDESPCPNCQLATHKFQHTINISDELARDGGFFAPPDFRDWLVAYAKTTDAEMLGAT